MTVAPNVKPAPTPETRGQPPKGAEKRRALKVYLSPAEVARLDEVRGELTRSAWLAGMLRGDRA